MVSEARYAVGVDFGTESGRAVLVAVADGRELATAVHSYRNGVIDHALPVDGSFVTLPADWALQDPDDYLAVLRNAVPAVVRDAGVSPSDIIGIGIDFTACTMLPTLRDGTPLSRLPEFRSNPHAWVKLWKHHAAQPQADRINATAERLGEPWLERYGGRISSEWFFAKTLQILEEAPEVYAAADRLIEAADWVVWQLTGTETRNACTAGYKAMWSKRDGFPRDAFFAALDPRLEHVVDDKMLRSILPVGARAGSLSAAAADLTGLPEGIAVAVANVDAHVSVPASTVTQPGRLVAVIGTSTCHVLLGDQSHDVEGQCGVVEDGVIPGLFGYEAGQSGVGDIFAWFVDQCVPAYERERAQRRGLDVHDQLAEEAERLEPGQSGLLALDWWNGNRSILVDADLSGLLIGATLATRPAEIYRALIEATAFGTRLIVESFQNAGVPVREIVACGGLVQKNRLLMQIYADITGLEISVAASSQTPALGSAMFAAVAAGPDRGGYATITDAAACMAHLSATRFVPIPQHHATYDRLYGEYVKLHDLFGRGGSDVMKTLRQIRATASGGR